MTTQFGPKLAEGKTKIIYQHPEDPYVVLIQSKDDITAGDGERRSIMDTKSVWSTTTTCNCFELLDNEVGIGVHYIAQEDETTFRARRVNMIPLELVARRFAWGSYLKRQPNVTPKTRFEVPVIEFFEKDDANHDPLLVFDIVGERVLRYEAKKPLKEGFMSETPFLKDRFTELNEDYLVELRILTLEVFSSLEVAWTKQGITLVDLKIECGFDSETGDIIVADVIDNDSWRIWPDGDEKRQLDKQAFRDLTEVTSEALDEIGQRYALVAEATKKFLK